MNANEIFDRHKQPGEDDPIADRARWHQAVDSDPTVPEEVKVVLRWYWDRVEALETEKESKVELLNHQA